MFLSRISLVLGLLLSFAADANAARILGATRLLPVVQDADLIHVAGRCPGPLNPVVRRIQLRVLLQDAEIEKFGIRYGSGIWQEVFVRENFQAGSVSRIIDLPGGARCIEQIFVLGSTRGPGQARVEVIGFRN
jgi:hypothetical protein